MGFGTLAEYGFEFIGSTDVTHHIIQLQPAEEVLFDFAHIDIFTANNAESCLARDLDWISMH